MSTTPADSSPAGTAAADADFVLDDDALRAVLTSSGRPTRPNALAASLTFGWRAMLKIRHVPEQLSDVTIFPVMLTLMFTYLFGGAIAGSTEDYLQFLLPGIVVQTVVFTTVYTGVTLNTDISKGVYDRFRSMPIWRPAPLVGALIGDAVRYTIGSTVVILLGLVLGFRPDGGPVGVVAAVLLLLVFSFGLGWVFTLLGLVMRSPNAVMSTGMMVLFPLTFASNIFVNPDTMPSWLQSIVDHNPITRMVDATRGLMGGDATAEQIAWVLAATAVLTLVFAPLVMRRYRDIA
jgi:ABC-2 type transport system permease protein